jgi:hypothetical protein
MRRSLFILVAIVVIVTSCALWRVHQRRLHEARLLEYPPIARPLASRVLSAGDSSQQQDALLACAEGLTSLSSSQRADVYITLLRHRSFDASSALCFLHIALLDRPAFIERASAYQQSSTFSSLSDRQRTYTKHMFSMIQTATYDDWSGKEIQ